MRKESKAIKKEQKQGKGKNQTHYLEGPGTQFGGKGAIGAIGGPEAAGWGGVIAAGRVSDRRIAAQGQGGVPARVRILAEAKTRAQTAAPHRHPYLLPARGDSMPVGERLTGGIIHRCLSICVCICVPFLCFHFWGETDKVFFGGLCTSLGYSVTGLIFIGVILLYEWGKLLNVGTKIQFGWSQSLVLCSFTENFWFSLPFDVSRYVFLQCKEADQWQAKNNGKKNPMTFCSYTRNILRCYRIVHLFKFLMLGFEI